MFNIYDNVNSVRVALYKPQGSIQVAPHEQPITGISFKEGTKAITFFDKQNKVLPLEH